MVGDEDFEPQLARATPNAQEQYSISTEDHSIQGEVGDSFVTPNAQEQFPISQTCYLLRLAPEAVGS